MALAIGYGRGVIFCQPQGRHSSSETKTRIAFWRFPKVSQKDVSHNRVRHDPLGAVDSTHFKARFRLRPILFLKEKVVKHLRPWLALMILVAFTGSAQAQTWTFSASTGSSSGEINVQGYYYAGTDWTAGSTATVRAWQGGTCVYTFVIATKTETTTPPLTGFMSTAITGLSSGGTYYVTVEATLLDTATGLKSMTIVSDPKTPTAK